MNIESLEEANMDNIQEIERNLLIITQSTDLELIQESLTAIFNLISIIDYKLVVVQFEIPQKIILMADRLQISNSIFTQICLFLEKFIFDESELIYEFAIMFINNIIQTPMFKDDYHVKKQIYHLFYDCILFNHNVTYGEMLQRMTVEALGEPESQSLAIKLLFVIFEEDDLTEKYIWIIYANLSTIINIATISEQNQFRFIKLFANIINITESDDIIDQIYFTYLLEKSEILEYGTYFEKVSFFKLAFKFEPRKIQHFFTTHLLSIVHLLETEDYQICNLCCKCFIMIIENDIQFCDYFVENFSDILDLFDELEEISEDINYVQQFLTYFHKEE